MCLAETGQIGRALYLENKLPFRLYIAYHGRYVSEASHVEIQAHALQTVHVWYKAVNKEELFT